ncbi:uncharacterized protein LOC18428573 isoform X2 [Amborella trichopoda]|uniref:uncharacterized protein LOC18428573 isoform X2 n=1 Tax=Amborella trichopoda TaxID=13333 RepID=UPI0009BDFAAC|nr:uncharacterized protein LOC18428573 isoform X2 [Amborella trichopoda]|eukprot:XP_020519481.1 uncharacterized protein LOC18428573 isoform X2 [Amborella trichopoda]
MERERPSNPSPMRVLTRPSSSPSASSPSPSSLQPPPSISLSPSSRDGVVVVGVVGREFDQTSQLLNRLLDANVFGSGHQDHNLCPKSEETSAREFTGDESFSFSGSSESGSMASEWFRTRRISYFYDDEKGIVFLLFVSSFGSLLVENSPGGVHLPSLMEGHDAGDLRGLLVMFSVCHVIMFVNEGARFDTRILRTFRMLQSAKNALAPFVKIHITPTMMSSKSSHFSAKAAPNSSNQSPGRGGMLGRHSSSISLMSGSYHSLFPGQCTPVILFVFLDDFADSPNSGLHSEDSLDASLSPAIAGANLGASGVPLSSGTISIPRPGSSSSKASSNPVVMLSRPSSKTEGGFRKKLQSSLEGQLRFLIKKSRTIAGGEGTSLSGSRSGMSLLGGAGMGGTLFCLDGSKAVALLDRSANLKGESLNFVTGLIEEVLHGKVASDIFFLENHSQSSNKEDIQSIKEFVYRQSDILRGRGGLGSNTSSGSNAGVGMVAVAAAAAAAASASVAGGAHNKNVGNPPELPSLENWLSASRLLLETLISARTRPEEEKVASEIVGNDQDKWPHGAKGGAVESKGKDAIAAALSCLESGMGLDEKFSTQWCQSALPMAKEVYLNGLPPCYPTDLHETHMEKAVCSFRLMVRGLAVPSFTDKLREECVAIWKSGRQLCDAISLTGKPCVHQRHRLEISDLAGTCQSYGEVDELKEAPVKPHSSGYVFIHACACGRSRRLREDPFDFESANVTFNRFPNCENLLPSLVLPKTGRPGPLRASAWSLVRVGGAKYYEATKGLLQSGFCSTGKFLPKFVISYQHQNGALKPEWAPNSKALLTPEEIPGKLRSATHGGQGLHEREFLDNVPQDGSKIQFGKDLPLPKTKKPFSEVVVGSVDSDLAFPPLQQKKQSTVGSGRGTKQKVSRERKENGASALDENKSSLKSEDVSSVQESSHSLGALGQSGGSPVLQIGSNVVPVIMNGNQTAQLMKFVPTVNKVVVYVGFEHECSYGHRFLISLEHLKEFGGPYEFPGKSQTPDEQMLKQTKMGEKDSDQLPTKVMSTYVGRKLASKNKQNEIIAKTGKGVNLPSSGFTIDFLRSGFDLEGDLQRFTIGDGGGGLSLLDMNLPIYMNCPHCRMLKTNNKKNVKFASTVSQLQRIFMVTPQFPTVLATNPIVEFEDHSQQAWFGLGCLVVLPPESFLVLRLPFVYGVQLNSGHMHPLNYNKNQPELTAWIAKGTALQVLSKGSHVEGEFLM